MADATARAELYSRSSEVIGVDDAGTLMNYLPGDESATKSDISALDGRMDRFEQRMDRFEDRLQALEDKIDQRMDSFHSACRIRSEPSPSLPSVRCDNRCLWLAG